MPRTSSSSTVVLLSLILLEVNAFDQSGTSFHNVLFPEVMSRGQDFGSSEVDEIILVQSSERRSVQQNFTLDTFAKNSNIIRSDLQVNTWNNDTNGSTTNNGTHIQSPCIDGIQCNISWSFAEVKQPGR